MSLDVVVEIENATIGYSEPILKNVNFSLQKGEFVYLIGKTASGKSSLIKSLYAELPLLDGDIHIAGYDLQKIKSGKIPYLRRKVSVVFQDFQLLTDRTVHENLKFVLHATGWKKRQEIDERIFDVLQRVGMESKQFVMPHQLSGGEQQRVVIARALLNDPEVILADEPTGNLDPDTSEDILQLLSKISNSGRVVIMATHNYNLLKKYPAKTFKCENNIVEELKEEENAIDFDSLLE